MTNTRARRVETSWGGVLGRVLLAAIITGGAAFAMTERAEAQTVVVERSQPVQRTERVTETTVVETENYPSGAGHWLMGGGAFLLTAGWVSSFVVGLHEGPELFISDAELNRERQWYEDFRFTSFIPIAGPWIALSQKPTEFDSDWWGVWLVANGLIQAAGFTMFVSGIIASAAHDSRVARRRTVRTVGVQSVTPSVSPEQVGLSVAGHF